MDVLADYNIFAGRLWIIVLVATWIAPAVSYYATQNRESRLHFLYRSRRLDGFVAK